MPSLIVCSVSTSVGCKQTIEAHCRHLSVEESFIGIHQHSNTLNRLSYIILRHNQSIDLTRLYVTSMRLLCQKTAILFLNKTKKIETHINPKLKI